MACSSALVAFSRRSEEEESILNSEEIEERDIVIDVEAVSDDDDIYVLNSKYTEGDFDYVESMQSDEEEEEEEEIKVEPIGLIDENSIEATDQEYPDSEVCGEKSSLRQHLDSLRKEDEDVPAVKVVEPVTVAEAAPKLLKCFECLKIVQKIRKEWKRCNVEGCRALMCLKCFARVNSLKTGSSCICCARKYIKGPTREYKLCRKCRYWRCPMCNMECRCILRSRASHHNFF